MYITAKCQGRQVILATCSTIFGANIIIISVKSEIEKVHGDRGNML